MGKLLKLFIVILVGIALLSVLGFLINVLVGLAAVALKIIFIIAVVFFIYKCVQYIKEAFK